MNFDLQRLLESKRALRQDLASRPIMEKLAMLEALRDRTRMIRRATVHKESGKLPGPAVKSDETEQDGQ